MPKLSLYHLLISGFLLVSCGVQEVVRTPGLPPVAEDEGSLRIAARTDDFLASLSPQTFNGAVVLEKEGKLINGSGYGYAWYNQKLPFTTKTVSNTAFLARQFTAASLLKLQANNRLSLQDSLGQFFREVPPRFQGIRLIHLLQNTSGLPYDVPEPEKVKSKEAFLEAVWNLSLLSKPGKEFHYSNAAFRLLAAVTEAAAGTDYESFLRKEILLPAGMYNTGYVLPDFQQALQAKSIRENKEEDFLYMEYKKDPDALWHRLGSSGMLSSGEDLYLWLQLLFKSNGWSAYEKKLIQAASFSGEMGTAAFGWQAENGAADTAGFLHKSSHGGYFCQLMYLPGENVFLVILANQVNGQVENLGEQLVRVTLFPYFVPAPLPYSGEKLVRIPQEEEAGHVRALLAYLQDSTASGFNALYAQHLSPDFRNLLPESNHRQALEKLRQWLGNATLEKAEQKMPFYLFTFFSPEAGSWYQLRVEVDPQQSYKINTIGLETTDAPN